MGKLSESAKIILMKAIKREPNKRKVAHFYGIPPDMLDGILIAGCGVGTLTARQILRIELARLEAEKKGIKNFMPEDKDKYKGTRSY